MAMRSPAVKVMKMHMPPSSACDIPAHVDEPLTSPADEAGKSAEGGSDEASADRAGHLDVTTAVTGAVASSLLARVYRPTCDDALRPGGRLAGRALGMK